jgi:hypothetical protein
MNSEQAVAMVRQELSRRARLGHVALLMASICGGLGIVSLWLTEPALPLRTHAAFLLLTMMAAGWAWHAIRVLQTRAVLLVLHRVRASWLAVLCSSAFTAAGLGAWWLTGWRPGGAAALSGAVLTMAAVSLLLRARRQRSLLMARLRELEGRA